MVDLVTYETRRSEIEASKESIQGIFYIYKGEIISDYYSECLGNEKISDEMRHREFFPNYMARKFPELRYNINTDIPRGRVEMMIGDAIIFIDKCYGSNEAIIKSLIQPYRLENLPLHIITDNYNCQVCRRGKA